MAAVLMAAARVFCSPPRRACDGAHLCCLTVVSTRWAPPACVWATRCSLRRTARRTPSARQEMNGDGAPLVCTSGACRERGVACTRTGVFPATEPVYPVAGRTLSAFLVSSCELAGVTHDALFMVMDGERLALPLTEAPLLTPFGDVLPGSFRFRAAVPPPRLGARLTLAVHHSQPAEPGRILGGSNTTLLRVSVLLRRGSTASARRVAASPPSNATTVPGGACSIPKSSRSHGRRLNGCCSSGYNHRSDRLG
jgi:hypothetical protein